MNGEASEEAIRRPHDKIATRRRACRAAVRAYAPVHLLHSESDDGLEGLLRVGRVRLAASPLRCRSWRTMLRHNK